MKKKQKKQIAELEFQKLIKLANQANGMLLGSHIYLLVMFAVMHVDFMVWVNVVSILVYLVNFYLIRRNMNLFFGNTYVEILLHMTLAILAVGWDSGFQIYAFALMLTIYYCDYIGKKIGTPSLHPRVVSIAVAVLYVLLYVESHYFSAFYTLKNPKSYQSFYIVNAIFVLVFIIIYVENFEALVLQTEERLTEAAEKDELTMLDNRRSMQERLNQLLNEKDKKGEIAVAILDIDDFKLVNDTYGHSVGDMILKEVALRMKEKESKAIRVCRWGGEEFLVLAVGDAAYQNLIVVICDLLEKIRGDKYYYGKKCIQITISAGVSQWENEEKIEHTISRADACLYEAKAGGKDQYIAKKVKDRG